MAYTPVSTQASENEILPFRIHVSNKYLEITRQKLELARLPHEPQCNEWWTPKPQIESLIDFWLERYSWQEHEDNLNASLPQFRTSFQSSAFRSPVRIHFIHARSPHPNAVPLLLIPPFPLAGLSFGQIIPFFTDPDDADAAQPFHLVMPSLPGLGFSDPLPATLTSPISVTAGILDDLMKRIGYSYYVASNLGSTATSPADIDWRLIRYLSNRRSGSCLGAHFIAPPLGAPQLGDSAGEWTKWKIANFLKSGMLGYSKDDFEARRRLPASKGGKVTDDNQLRQMGQGDHEPNTPAYALCDSPVGLLLYVLKNLRLMRPKKELRPQDIITFTQLIWLPGPEAALRFWAQSARNVERSETEKPARKPKVSVTVFLGDTEPADKATLPLPARLSYVCPGWVKAAYDVVYTARAPGMPGLLAADRPELIVEGVRGLVKALLATDKRLTQTSLSGAALASHVPRSDDGSSVQAEVFGMRATHFGPETPPRTPPAVEKTPAPESPTSVGRSIADEYQDLVEEGTMGTEY